MLNNKRISTNNKNEYKPNCQPVNMGGTASPAVRFRALYCDNLLALSPEMDLGSEGPVYTVLSASEGGRINVTTTNGPPNSYQATRIT